MATRKKTTKQRNQNKELNWCAASISKDKGNMQKKRQHPQKNV
jgi:hypothetical protein